MSKQAAKKPDSTTSPKQEQPVSSPASTPPAATTTPTSTVPDFEKLGVFYLGREYDLKAGKLLDKLLLYDSKDLVTHAVCVGMTGSGKTGLCLTLLEEAAIDGIPAIVIDPKGDLGNLLLTFPDLKADDFQPWINANEAKNKGMSVEEYAQDRAATWKKGLEDWGQDGARIKRLRDAADFTIFTPGSNAGVSVSIMKSFAAPNAEILNDKELLRDRISTTATSLLGLMGIDADPLQSREHILLSTILNNQWQAGKDLELATLIHQIQTPSVNKIGILDLEAYFPEKDRFPLAMRLNNLLAAPGFEAWLEGEALDIDSLLHMPDGKPRVAIFSIAHLNDTERMFFVSLLLNQVLGWVRTQPGTTSLRALLYMDEIFGYFPPVANPPSKLPLLTLLKQARAFGLGVVLATQNPVDLDYKGLANAGTWFIGRLQTERDKMRVLEGLEGAAATTASSFNRKEMEQLLAGLSTRVFLMNNVHDTGPVVFQVRWAMSYLSGPLTRNQLKTLMDSHRGVTTPAQPPVKTNAGMALDGPPPVAKFAPPDKAKLGQRPLLPPEIPQYYLSPRTSAPAGCSLVYRPMLAGIGEVYFSDKKTGVEEKRPVSILAAINEGAVAVSWTDAASTELTNDDLEKTEPAEGGYATLPPEAGKPKNFDAWKKSFADALYRTQTLDILRSPALKQYSHPEESDRDFRLRLQQAARESRDEKIAKIRQDYGPKLAALEERRRKAKQAKDREKEQATQSKIGTAISVLGSVLNIFGSRKKISAGNIGRATTVARGVSKSMKESGDVGRAEDNIEAVDQKMAELEQQIKEETDRITAKVDPMTEELETTTLKPKKTNVSVQLVSLVWVPHWLHQDGTLTAAWE